MGAGRQVGNWSQPYGCGHSRVFAKTYSRWAIAQTSSSPIFIASKWTSP